MLANRTLQAAASGTGYQIQRSLRFRAASTAYITRTFGTPTNQIKWTWSGWVKRGRLGVVAALIGTTDNNLASGNVGALRFVADDTLEYFEYQSGYVIRLTTTQVFRDPSAWYHIVLTVDSAQATAANRVKMYVNGNQVTTFAIATYPSLSAGGYVNYNGAHYMGAYNNSTTGIIAPFDGYLSEVNFIDGQALDPSSFGQTDLLSGVWSAKRYSGAYGNNGFYLNFSDPTSTTLVGYDRRSGAYSRNLRSSGTAIGGFTANGGLASAFDGNTNQPNASSARSNAPAAGYTAASAIGRDWGLGITKVITAFRIYGQNDGGMVGGTTQTTNYKLQGSNDGTNYTDLMSPGTTTGATSEIVTVTSGITTTTAYRYHRVIFNANGADNYYVTELELYEAGIYVIGPNDWTTTNIALSGSTAISTFTSTGTTSWIAPAGVTSVEYLVVGGGGGGAGGAGSNGGNGGPGGAGGPGTASSISGSAVVYAGGGGGYGDTHGPGPNGAGSGSTPNRGGGGSSASTAGGSGIVILSYPGSPTVPTYDSMLDVPLGSGGSERGNYCTLNPISTSVATYVKEANLSLSGNSLGEYPGVGGTVYVSTGKWYWEYVAVAGGTLNCTFGFSPALAFGGTFQTATGSVGYTNDTGAITVSNSTVTTGASFTSGDLIAVALDLTAGTAQFYKNNVATGALVTGLTGTYTPAMNLNYYPSNTVYLNCGQRPFNYAPPTGFLPLHTGNFSTPTIKKPNEHFDASLWRGDGIGAQSVTNSGNFLPDLVWMKGRNFGSAGQNHVLVDSVRGANIVLSSNLTNVEAALSSISAFSSNGFITSGTADNGYSGSINNMPYVAWQWKAGGAAIANNAGSIASQVSANTLAGFSIVTYTGNGTNGATVGHGLGVVPALIITKKRNSVGTDYGWSTYHKENGTANVWLHLTNAKNPANWTVAPSSSVFTPAVLDYNNVNTATYVNYCFAEVAGYSKMGTYTGNGSAAGPFIYCGFRPKYIMVKRTDVGDNWFIEDTSRNPSNPSGLTLKAQDATAEATNTPSIDIVSNGFKIRNTYSGYNTSGGTYVFIAFAEAPFKYALAR